MMLISWISIIVILIIGYVSVNGYMNFQVISAGCVG